MKPVRAVFAIPGDMDRRTGGFIYESTVLRALRSLGHEIEHLQLPDSFPDPSPADIQRTFDLLEAVPADTPILLDGFIPGTVDPAGLARIRAPLIPIIHHPLGLETGLPATRAAFLLENEAAALAHATRIVVPSPHTARLLIDRFDVPAPRITVAPPGFDAPGGTRRPAQPPVILSVGILARRKGHDVLIDALARLKALDWQARIVGEAHDHAVADALARQVAQAGLDDRVIFTGPLDDAQVQREYASAEIFALASRFEGYGIVFGEAMKWGLPIVACRAGAVPDTVGDAGLLVPADAPAAFADAIRVLLTDRPARLTLAAKAARAGDALPSWRETATIIAATVAAAGSGHPGA